VGKTKVKSGSQSESRSSPTSGPVPTPPAPSDAATKSAALKICIFLFLIVYVAFISGYYILAFLLGLDLGREGLNPKLTPALSLFFAFLSTLIPLVLVMGYRYRRNPSQTTRGFMAILGLTGAVAAGYFTGMWHVMGYMLGLYPLINMRSHPWALVLGISSSLLACFIFTLNMLKIFYRI